MSKVSEGSAKRTTAVVRQTVVTPRGSAVKATRLELTKEAVRSLESKSSGIHSKKDHDDLHRWRWSFSQVP